ncbi:PREDICTED: protein Cep89 homolog [Drosophila arizonae]|uniref:Protein Cep89 homolog n=1 Tax=Drosophila arizonae TaxID=7263 RepID=A0ABM1PC99_DROAR|nr:PREDICTED: protein Cep89 homolog [Drosophila arizonae]
MARRGVPITDLDQSEQEPEQEQEKAQEPEHLRPATQPKRQRKVLQTLTGNFSRRSRSVEVEHRHPADVSGGSAKKKQQSQERTLNGLLQAKEQQLEQLLQRLSTLHKYNEQFARENERLRDQTEQLEQRLAAAEQRVASCERCQQLQQQQSQLLLQNQELSNDVDMLKTLVFRLNVQIECYQDQRRMAQPEDAPLASAANSCSLPPFSAQLGRHTLAPLLQAYDESLRDKDALLSQYAADFELFSNELKRALEENTKLLQAQEQLRRDVGGWQEERVRLQAQLSVCRSKAETQTRKTDLVKEKLVEVMHFYEQRNQTLLLDMNHLQDAYARCKAELVSLKSPASASAPAAPPPVDTNAAELQQCKALLEQLKQEHAKERAALEAEKQASSTRVASLQRSCEKAKHARDRLKARLRMTLQWAQKLEAGQAELRETYDAVQQLSTLLKHKESQLRGMQLRNSEELDKLRHKLQQKDETIRNLLRSKMERRPAVD